MVDSGSTTTTGAAVGAGAAGGAGGGGGGDGGDGRKGQRGPLATHHKGNDAVDGAVAERDFLEPELPEHDPNRIHIHRKQIKPAAASTSTTATSATTTSAISPTTTTTAATVIIIVVVVVPAKHFGGHVRRGAHASGGRVAVLGFREPKVRNFDLTQVGSKQHVLGLQVAV